MSLLRWD